jgi:hypothetical protein
VIRSLRRAHRTIWWVLALLPIVVLLALSSRPEPVEPISGPPWTAADGG